MVALKLRYQCILICFIPIFTLLFIHHQNILSPNGREKTYFNLEKLKAKVDTSSGDILVHDINVSSFLRDLEVDDVKWNISRHTDAEIHNSWGEPSIQTDQKLKTILYWNEAYGSTQYGFCCGQEPYWKYQCPYTNCYVTDNRTHLPSIDQYDAILFHQRSLSKTDLPQKRKAEQKYIMYMLESASYPFGFVSSQWNGFFNWTMTYRQDSDFYSPYGSIQKTQELPENLPDYIQKYGEDHQDDEIIRGKTKAIAWFVSNCEANSNRLEYVKALQKHIAVDIYGKCGTLKCSRSDENACWRQVNADYFFYLSFENSICADYVTEKFFNAMNQSVVPVVLGGANYGQMAPPQSVIDVWKDYRNDPGQLAKVLQNLIDDKQSYAQYFWWKDFYRISDFNPARHFCQICEKLHQKEATTHSSYQDLEEWWEHSARCKKVHVPMLPSNWPPLG